jgi:hypothetical protein
MADAVLPLSMFVTIAAPGSAKNETDVKLNFILNKTAPSIVSLFEDVVESLDARAMCTNKK